MGVVPVTVLESGSHWHSTLRQLAGICFKSTKWSEQLVLPLDFVSIIASRLYRM